MTMTAGLSNEVLVVLQTGEILESTSTKTGSAPGETMDTIEVDVRLSNLPETVKETFGAETYHEARVFTLGYNIGPVSMSSYEEYLEYETRTVTVPENNISYVVEL